MAAPCPHRSWHCHQRWLRWIWCPRSRARHSPPAAVSTALGAITIHHHPSPSITNNSWDMLGYVWDILGLLRFRKLGKTRINQGPLLRERYGCLGATRRSLALAPWCWCCYRGLPNAARHQPATWRSHSPAMLTILEQPQSPLPFRLKRLMTN